MENYTITYKIFGVDLEDGGSILIFDPEFYAYTLFTCTEVGSRTIVPPNVANCAAVGASALESANVVGYQTYDASLTDDMATIGVAFSNVGAASGDYVITTTMFGRDVEDNDQILLWDNDNYNLINYTYYDGLGWTMTDALGNESPAASITVSKGQVLWFLPNDPANAVSVSGEVAASGTQTLTFSLSDGDCFSFVNPFPKDTLFSELTTFCADSDQFILWDNANYNLVNYTYYDGLGWTITDAFGDETAAVETDVAIPAGTGAYFLPADDRTWTVTFNY